MGKRPDWTQDLAGFATVEGGTLVFGIISPFHTRPGSATGVSTPGPHPDPASRSCAVRPQSRKGRMKS